MAQGCWNSPFYSGVPGIHWQLSVFVWLHEHLKIMLFGWSSAFIFLLARISLFLANSPATNLLEQSDFIQSGTRPANMIWLCTVCQGFSLCIIRAVCLTHLCGRHQVLSANKFQGEHIKSADRHSCPSQCKGLCDCIGGRDGIANCTSSAFACVFHSMHEQPG